MKELEQLKEKIKFSGQRVFTRQEIIRMIDLILPYEGILDKKDDPIKKP